MGNDGDIQQIEWILEGVLPDGRTWIIALEPLPFRIGRLRDCQVVLNSPSVSRAHAEIYLEGDTLSLRDMGSTNGTFLNGARLKEPATLHSGDILHFGEVEFRVAVSHSIDHSTDTFMTLQSPMELSSLLPRHEKEFLELLNGRHFRTLFQPIVDLSSGLPAAYEAVGRGTHPGLPIAPMELFQVADRLGKSPELSHLLRMAAAGEGAKLPGRPRLYLNLHPSETFQPRLMECLEELRRDFPELPITIEISEKALVEPGRMRQFKSDLKGLGMCLAYDDFGAGQARILELIQAPPDVLKFDMALVRGLHEAPPTTRKMLCSLVSMSADLGVETLAEGIECEGERVACQETGFTYGQGFYLGPPTSLRDSSASTDTPPL
jgi:EAL domain-containing protein (putative c-di-GMP-specific phosphodiesterase class I)